MELETDLHLESSGICDATNQDGLVLVHRSEEHNSPGDNDDSGAHSQIDNPKSREREMQTGEN